MINREKLLQEFKQRNSDRIKRHNYLKKNLTDTSKTLKDTLKTQLKNFSLNNPNIKQLIKDSITQTTHLGNISWEYLKSLYDFSYLENPQEKAKHNKIIAAVASGEQLDPIRYEQSEIFHTIFEELKLYSIDPERSKQLVTPKIDATIVLLSGVFNEMFHKADFERGVANYCTKTGTKYLVPQLSGIKSSLYNTKLLEEQLTKYIQENPKQKLWILAFSKGGIDLLHYLKKNHKFAKQHIIGASMIAVPILGTYHLEKKRVKLINLIHKIPHRSFQNIINKYGVVLSPEFQLALDANYRAPWFKRNYNNIPEELFYTALAFDSNWLEGHFWMKLTKILLNNKEANDGIVEASNALFPDYFFGVNLGIEKGHHLVGMHSSAYPQEELIEAHIIYLHYIGVL